MTDRLELSDIAAPDRIEYRLSGTLDGPVALVLHGGHMSAQVDLGEATFHKLGYTVITPSRPGYGRTPLTAGSHRS